MRKKLFAILMSAMMMVTFMPAMAFAAVTNYVTHDATHGGYELGAISFSNDYATASAKLICHTTGCGYEYATLKVNTEREIDSGGVITAKADFSSLVPENTEGNKVGEKSYIDLTGASLGNHTSAVTLSADDYLNCISTEKNAEGKYYLTANPFGNYIKLIVPSYVKGYATMTESAKIIYRDNVNANRNLTVTVYPGTYEAYDADGEYDLPIAITTFKADGATDVDIPVIGTPVASQKVKIALGKTDNDALTNVKAGFAGKTPAELDDERNSYTTVYTGSDLGFAVTTKGLKAEYKLKSWTPVYGTPVAYTKAAYTTTAPVIKDAGAYVMDIKVTREKEGALSFSREFTNVEVNVTRATATVGFTQLSYKFNEGTKITDNMLLGITGVVEADLATAKALVAQAYKVTGIIAGQGTSVLGYAATSVVATLRAARTADEYAAVEAKYPGAVAFLNNYQIAPGTTTAYLTITNDDNDVTTVDQTKTYKNKTGKLAKTWTFMCKGDFADYGTLSYYKTSGNAKITVAKDGKVTVKKGLKKGTYTVKIKVKAPGASAVKTLKVIVKK